MLTQLDWRGDMVLMSEYSETLGKEVEVSHDITTVLSAVFCLLCVCVILQCILCVVIYLLVA